MALVLKTSGALIVRAAVSAKRSARFCPASASLSVSNSSSSTRSIVPQARPRSHQRAGRTGAVVTMSLFTSTTTANSAHEFTVTDIDGRKVDLGQYKGKVLLVVNVASQCGFTPQYKELAELDAKYSKQGLVILGFPCNQFGSQEKASNPEIKKFAEARGAKFPMMAKVEVNGSAADPFYKFLKAKQGGLLVPDIKWNFTKFLVDKEGNVVKRYGSATTPLSIEDDIKRLL